MTPNWRNKFNLSDDHWVWHGKVTIVEGNTPPRFHSFFDDNANFIWRYDVGKEWLKANLTPEEWASYVTEKLTA